MGIAAQFVTHTHRGYGAIPTPDPCFGGGKVSNRVRATRTHAALAAIGYFFAKSRGTDLIKCAGKW